MFSIMEYVTGTVQRHWARHRADAVKPGAPLFLGRSMMLIDEAWHLIRRDETGEYANDLARRARHLGLALIVMSQQLSDFNTDYGKALVRNSAQQLLLAQNPQEIPFIAETVELSEREASELGRLKTIKGRHAQMLWLNGARGHGKVTLRVGPTEYWAFTSDPTEVAIRDERSPSTTATCGRRSAHSPAAATRTHRDDAQRRVPAIADGKPVESATRSRTTRPRRIDSRQCWRCGDRLGPLLAVCGLGRRGGRDDARLSDRARRRPAGDGPVLVADAGGPSGGLAVLRRRGVLALARRAGRAARRTACRSSGASTRPPETACGCSRADPSSRTPAPHDQLRSCLGDAREAHGLTVIDCGTLAREVEQTVAAAATHVAWVLPATTHGVERGRRVLEAAPRMAARR